VTGVDCSSADDELPLGCVLGVDLGGGSDGGFSSVPVAKQKTKDYKPDLGPVVPSVQYTWFNGLKSFC